MEKSSLTQSKLSYLAVEKLQQNWVAGSRNNTRLVTSYDRANPDFRKSEDILAFVNSDRTVKVFDLCSTEPSLLSSWNLESEKRISIIFVLESYLVIGYFDRIIAKASAANRRYILNLSEARELQLLKNSTIGVDSYSARIRSKRVYPLPPTLET